MIVNYAVAVTSSTAITFALFFVMQMLISIQPAITIDDRDHHELIWVLPDRADDPPIVDSSLIERPEFKHPPETRFADPDHEMTGLISVPASNPRPPVPTRTKFDYSLSDGPLVNVVRVRPKYPPDAARRDLEGYVIVQFDVLVNGQVANVSVVEASHRVFISSALKAASRLKYKPRVIDGSPVGSVGIRYQFTFEMEM